MKNARVFFALLGIAALSACTNPFTGGGRGGEGTIAIAFDSAPVPVRFTARSVVDPDDMIHYITLIGSGGRTIPHRIEGLGPATISVPPGNWRVSVRGMGDRPDALSAIEFRDLMVRAVGETSVEVLAGQSSPAIIEMISVIGIYTRGQLRDAVTADGLDVEVPLVPLRLITDLDLNDWMPVNFYFNGVFDGGGHAISELDASLFNTIPAGSEVRNLRLVFVEIYGGGALAVENHGTVENVSVSGTVSNDDAGVAGVGGIVGINYGTVETSFATGNVSSTGDYVGGIAGINRGTVRNSFATGNVTGTTMFSDYIGGIVGQNEGTVENVFATGNVLGGANVGGIVGWNNTGAEVRNNVVLSPLVYGSSGAGFNRVVGVNLGTAESNYGRSIPGTWDGVEITADEWHSRGWWFDAVGFDPYDVWYLADGRLPILRNMPPGAPQNPVVQ